MMASSISSGLGALPTLPVIPPLRCRFGREEGKYLPDALARSLRISFTGLFERYLRAYYPLDRSCGWASYAGRHRFER